MTTKVPGRMLVDDNVVSVVSYMTDAQRNSYRAGVPVDITSAIQAAIAQNAGTRAKISLTPGIGLISDTIAANYPVDIAGAGQFVTTLRATTGMAGKPMMQIDGQGSTVSDLRLDGNGIAQDGLQVRVPRVVVNNVFIDTTTQYGLYIVGIGPASAHANQFVNLRVLDCGADGVRIAVGGFDSEFANTWVGNCGGSGIYTDASDCFFANTHTWGCTQNGVRVRAANTRFVNLYSETNDSHGVDGFNQFNLSIVGGSIWKNGGTGMNLSTMQQIRLADLAIYDNAGNGITLASVTGFGVHDVDFFNKDASVFQDRPLVMSGTSDFGDIVGCRTNPSQHSVGGMTLIGSSVLVLDRDAGISLPVGVDVYGAAGSNREVRFLSGNAGNKSLRWIFRIDNTAEGGSDAGSNIQILSRTDAGGAKQIPVQINRQSGVVTVGDPAATATTNLRLNEQTQTNVGAAGGASALPATPLGYIVININGTDRKIPYYNT